MNDTDEKTREFLRKWAILMNNSTYGKMGVPTKQIVVRLKDNKDGINIIIIDGDEMDFALNGDLVVSKNGKCVAMFKSESFIYAHKY